MISSMVSKLLIFAAISSVSPYVRHLMIGYPSQMWTLVKGYPCQIWQRIEV